MERILRFLANVPIGPVIAIVTVGGLVLLSTTPTAAHRVPKLEGLQVNPAIERAAREGYFAKVSFRQGGGLAGTVIDQKPDADTIHNKGTRVVLVVTKGAAQVKVPDVVGVAVEEARRRLDRGHLVPGAVIYKDGRSTKPNHVVTTDPPAGRLVDVGTTVDITAAA